MKLDSFHAGEPFLLCLVIAQSGLAGGLGGSPPQGLAPWMPARVLENVTPGLVFPGDILGLTSAWMECQQWVLEGCQHTHFIQGTAWHSLASRFLGPAWSPLTLTVTPGASQMGHGGPMPYAATELEGGLGVGAGTRHSYTGQAFLFLEEINWEWEFGKKARGKEASGVWVPVDVWMRWVTGRWRVFTGATDSGRNLEQGSDAWKQTWAAWLMTTWHCLSSQGGGVEPCLPIFPFFAVRVFITFPSL